MQNSILCGVIFVFYCTRISKSKMASGRHLKGNLEITSSLNIFYCNINMQLGWATSSLNISYGPPHTDNKHQNHIFT